VTRPKFFPEKLEELLQALFGFCFVEVGATQVILGWFPMLHLVDFTVDFLNASCEGWGAEEGVYHAALEGVR
jgi:hypothetical protein